MPSLIYGRYSPFLDPKQERLVKGKTEQMLLKIPADIHTVFIVALMKKVSNLLLVLTAWIANPILRTTA
jgi:hypothetical protein